MSENKKSNENKIPDKIFIDADAYVALADKNDLNHKIAVKYAKVFKDHNVQVFASDYAFGEVITVISQRTSIKLALQIGKDITSSLTIIIDTDKTQRDKALELFSKQTSKNSRFTDMINMVLMDELKIDTIFSFDKHYPQNGYKLFYV